MFVMSQGPLPAMDFGFPDVCKTPVGPVVVPIPYPNIAMAPTAVPSQVKVLVMCMPAHNMTTMTPLSMGDNAGVLMGAVSQMDMATSAPAFGSTNLVIGVAPATKMTTPTKQNGICPNAPGLKASPSEVIMMSMR